MTLTIELPDSLQAALKEQAQAQGVSGAGYIRQMLELDLAASLPATALPPFETSFGSFAKYGPASTAEEIDANRADMFGRFGEE